MGSLTGKHVVVTGASAGIGAELCRQLGAQSAKVTLAARSIDKLATVAAEVEREGGQALSVPTDVTQREQVLKLAEAARTRFGEIDVWVNNAGAGVRHSLLAASEDDMLAQFKLNCLSSLWGYQAVVPGWLEHGVRGQVIDVASIAALAGYLHHGGYSAAKHGLSGLGKTLRQELAGPGITITTVYPGPTVSDFSQNVAVRDGSGSQAFRPGQVETRPEGRATGGSSTTLTSTDSYRQSRNPLVRAFAAKQSTEYIACVIIRAMQTRPLRVYPHRWGNLLAWLLERFERPVLGLLARGIH